MKLKGIFVVFFLTLCWINCSAGVVWELSGEKLKGSLSRMKCSFTSGSMANCSVEKFDGAECLKIDNKKGENRIINFKVTGLSGKAEYTVTIVAGVKEQVEKGNQLLLFFHQGSAFEVRVQGQINLVRKGHPSAVLGNYTPGKLLTITLTVDPVKHLITAAKINGKLVAGFKPYPWINNSFQNNFTIYATTPSSADIYIKSVKFESEEMEKTAPVTSNHPWMKRPVKIYPDSTPEVFQSGKTEKPVYKLNVERINNIKLPDNFMFTAEQLRKLPELVKKDQSIAMYLERQFDSIGELVQRGGLEYEVKKKPGRYVYITYGIIPQMALVYLLTGDKATGKLLKDLVLHTARQPMKFWIHEKLRRYDPLFPVGQLETGHLTFGMATAYAWAHDLFSPEECKELEDAIRYKGLYPCMRWVETSKLKSNFICLIAGGALAAARVLNEKDAAAIAQTKLLGWLDLLEDDGSYAEPVGYFTYGLTSFIHGILTLGSKDAIAAVQNTRLKDSMDYMLGFYSYNNKAPDGKCKGRLVNFGDDDFITRPNSNCMMFLAYAFNQGQGLWMIDKFYPADKKSHMYTMIQKIMFSETSVTPVPPAKLDLPAIAKYDNGFSRIRSGWTMDHDVLMALRGGDGGKTHYIHDMPNRNSIALFVDGVYLLNAPGRACYRNPLHFSYDNATINHNTITFGQATQVQNRKAHFTACVDNKDLCFLASDAAESCKMSQFKADRSARGIIYMKDRKYFIMIDDTASKIKANVEWNMHFANYDRTGKFQRILPDSILYSRMGVNLHMQVKCTLPTLWLESPNGIMHTGYSYLPGDEREGKPGSSFKLMITTENVTNKARFITFIYPQTADQPALKAKLETSENGVVAATISGDSFHDSFSCDESGVITVTRYDGSEKQTAKYSLKLNGK